ncbi:unnamed protein product [Parnassius apollo]|uniref:(apollo) hypothetical protein n=1 Tax=Parnassius apollo TaxID=110799 RepID=A0A8S3XWY1_PARAO|nr:unnamed protein product [Parnassius apollo]
MTAVKKVIAMRQLDSMFGSLTLEGEGRHSPLVSSTIEHDPHCDVHGRCGTPTDRYRSSLYLHSRESTPGHFRECVSPTNGLIIRRRDSLGVSPARELEHPSTFPSILRRDRHSPSQTPPRRDTPSPTHRFTTSKRHSMGSFPNLSRCNVVNYNRRDSLTNGSVRDMKRDYVGSMNSLSRKSSIDTKKSSSDSLDNWHVTWETDRNSSVSSLAHDDKHARGIIKVNAN